MACPKAKHFHVICRDVFEKEDFERVVEVSSANSALETVIKEIPASFCQKCGKVVQSTPLEAAQAFVVKHNDSCK
jgi:S-ribosylhomocysteine lyase LuxS involved in autoinducer biosynthesis